MTALPTTAYKVLTADQWAQFEAEGAFAGAPVDLADGYIHLSTAAQLDETIAKHFAGQTGLVTLAVDLTALDDVRWKASRGGALFPHLYGVLPMSAVSLAPLL
jgi:beta-hydroxylase